MNAETFYKAQMNRDKAAVIDDIKLHLGDFKDVALAKKTGVGTWLPATTSFINVNEELNSVVIKAVKNYLANESKKLEKEFNLIK